MQESNLHSLGLSTCYANRNAGGVETGERFAPLSENLRQQELVVSPDSKIL